METVHKQGITIRLTFYGDNDEIINEQNIDGFIDSVFIASLPKGAKLIAIRVTE